MEVRKYNINKYVWRMVLPKHYDQVLLLWKMLDMKELQYPFDTNYILTNKKSIRRKLLENTSGFLTKRIAILGGYTTNNVKLILELFLLDQGILPVFYESEYNQYYQDAIFGNESLNEFKPEVIYICTSNRNITKYPAMQDTVEMIDNLFTSEVDKYTSIWDSLMTRYHCPIIQNNFEMPFYRLLGNKDASDIHGKVNFLSRINMEIYNYAQTHKNFYVCDINYISADYGLREWSDPFYFYMYKYALNVNAIPYLSFNVANIIKSIFGKNKKGFVLDLDNTLWGGCIGEDGINNISLGLEEAEGQVYLEFQKYLREQKSLGLILNIDSKNDVTNAIAGLEHPDSELSKDDFVVIKSNWNSKDQNFKEIADSLSVLPESLIFVDDNPAERYIVTKQLQGVLAPDIGEPYQYIQNIDRGGYFEMTMFSEDDQKRNDMYKENIKRVEAKAGFSDYTDYLNSLEMKGIIKPFEAIYISRIAQLTNKSNQFNLTTRRYTQAEIEDLSANEDYITIYGRLIDRFGDNGIVSAVICHKIHDEGHIDLWIMSCRVLKRDMEFAMMDALINECKKQGIVRVYGYYYPTLKNGMVKNFYKILGFEKEYEDKEGNAGWSFLITDNYEYKNKVITVEG